MWQLPPPRGTFLGQIPWQLLTHVHSKKLPLTLQGQQLVWASAEEGGLQGVTELVQCERTQDKWLQELQLSSAPNEPQFLGRSMSNGRSGSL